MKGFGSVNREWQVTEIDLIAKNESVSGIMMFSVEWFPKAIAKHFFFKLNSGQSKLTEISSRILYEELEANLVLYLRDIKSYLIIWG